MKNVTITLKTTIPLDSLIDEESFVSDFDGDILKFCKWLHEEEGIFWDDIEIAEATISPTPEGER